jgi:gas vesicle protein
MNKILVSLLAGIAIGILLAPDKGSETLRKIRSRINDYTDQAAEEAADEADNLADKAKSAINKGKKKVNESFE